MSHLTPARIAAHLAGTDPQATAHVQDCEACARAVAATEIVAHATFGRPPSAPESPRPGEGMAAALDQISSPAAATIKALLSAAAVAREQDPPRALELSNRAVAVAQAMTGDPTMVQLLRARIWRERAGIHRMMGEYDAGLRALDVAERELDGVLVRGYEDAQIAYMRAGILWKGRIDEVRARELAVSAAEAFEQYGDSLRAIHARILIGGLAFVQGNFAAAREAYSTALPQAVALGDASTIAHLHQNIAACAQEMDELSVAAMHYASAVALFAHLDMKVEELRAEWNRGLLSLRMGHAVDGCTRLKRAADGFLSHGNASDAALVTLDLVEHLAAHGEIANASRELARIAGRGVPAYVRVQLEIVTAALRGGDLRPVVRDARVALLAPAP